MKYVLPMAGALSLALGAGIAQAEALTPINEVTNASCAAGTGLAGGQSYQVKLKGHDEEIISFQVLEPLPAEEGGNAIDCATPGAHPLLLHGPGFSGTRSTSGFEDYRRNGYTVISWDPRGFGDTTGTVRVMDPEFEGQYYVQILDWAEQALDYLAWHNSGDKKQFVERPDNAVSDADNGQNLLVGATGSSYGGGYQLMLLTVDGKKRLDAIMPDITWHDLRYALNPGDTVKTLWDLALSSLGTASGYRSGDSVDGMDPFIEETLARGAAMNEWPRQSLDWFHYRGLGYWCAANGLPAMPYTRYGVDNVPMFDTANSDNVPDRAADGRPGLGRFLQPLKTGNRKNHFKRLDVLLTQGMVDTLFNYNEAWWNYRCLTAAGAHVTLYTHNGGHALPGAQSPDKLPANSNSCPVDKLAWLNARLGRGGAVELAQTCFALGQGEDVVSLNARDVLAPGANNRFTVVELQGLNPEPAGVIVPNGVVGAAHLSGNLGVPAPLGTVGAGGAILAGIPNLKITVGSGHGGNEAVRAGAEAGDCAMQSVPLRTGCDSIVFVGVGKKTGGAPNFALIDDQLTPVRGLGEHAVDLVGIAERLQPGDELALLFFAEHPQFFSSVSRDVTLPAVVVSGRVGLPLYAVDENGNPRPSAPTEGLLQ